MEILEISKMSKETLPDNIKNFIASASPDVFLHDPTANDPKYLGGPQLPPNVTYAKKTIRFTVPKGRALRITAVLSGVKANSVFLSMDNDPRYIQIYKGESGNGRATTITGTHYSDPLPIDQTYLLTTASKDTPGREASQPWWNNHPLYEKPRADGYEQKTVWETDDSRNPGSYPNVTITWFHDGYDLNFEYVKGPDE